MFRKIEPPSESVEITVDGICVEAEAGEYVAAVLLRMSPFLSRTTPVGRQPRSPYCMMGACFDCLVTIDGNASQQSCLIPVRPGMRIERQHGRRRVF